MKKCNCVAYANYGHSSPMIFPKHKVVKASFSCPLCQANDQDWFYHGPSGDFIGSFFECSLCNKYIKYFHDESSTEQDNVSKEEFLIEDYYIIIYASKADNCIYKGRKLMYVKKFTFSKYDKKSMLQRIKTAINFA